MKSIELDVAKRDTRTNPRNLRRQGVLPGVLYGPGMASVAVTVDARAFSRSGLGTHGAHLIKFQSSDGSLSGRLALVKEMQSHPVSGAPTHVDFYRVDENKPVTASVALNYVGRAKGIVGGGILQPVRRELDVRALPANLPDQIDVDVSDLDIHDSIHVEDLKLPEGVEPDVLENLTLVTVIAPVVEAAAAEGEEGEVEATAAGADEEPEAEEA